VRGACPLLYGGCGGLAPCLISPFLTDFPFAHRFPVCTQYAFIRNTIRSQQECHAGRPACRIVPLRRATVPLRDARVPAGQRATVQLRECLSIDIARSVFGKVGGRFNNLISDRVNAVFSFENASLSYMLFA